MIAGVVIAGGVSLAARRAGSLTRGGQLAATALGTIVTVAGLGWAALLIGYFITSTALTRLGRAAKVARTAAILPEQEARTATQVLANGGVYAAGLALGALLDDPRWAIAASGALAAAAADTWATELGTLWGGVPRSILSGRAVERGESGGITLVGLGGSALAAVLVALAADLILAADGVVTTGLVIAGLAGSVGDSFLGATVQSKRWCTLCRSWTERWVHPCGTSTSHLRGVRWMTNDTVNLLATVVGALVALALVPPR